ncbi:MAG: fibronectin type III domain-containing protein, partial [Treponema sp.]|nr:fibronectin type III domain-containing protein [Treponema sp.]
MLLFSCWRGAKTPSTSEKKELPSGPLDVNKGWNSADGMGIYLRNLQARGGDGEVTLSWNKPDSKQVAYVKISYSNSLADVQSGTSAGEARTDKAAATGITIENLTNETLYYFALTPMSAEGAALGQALIISATPHRDDPERPDDVEGLGGNPGSGQISLSWKMPSSHSDQTLWPAKKVVSVEVSIVPREGTVEVVTSNWLGALAAGLQNGKPYTLIIRTVNEAGKKSYGVTTVQIPSGVGGGAAANPNEGGSSANAQSVKNLQAIPDDGKVTLYWEDPAVSFDSLRIYYAYDDPNDPDDIPFDDVQDAVHSAASSQPAASHSRIAVQDYIPAQKNDGIRGFTIGSLTNDTLYCFAVTPVILGAVIDSPIIVSATPSVKKANQAADVEGLWGTPGDGQIRLSWNYPLPKPEENTRIDEIRGITVLPDESGTVVAVYEGQSGAKITGLTNGQPYNFTVKTTNDAGIESMGRSLVLTPQEAASAPGPGDGGGGSGGGGSSLNLVRVNTNIQISGDYLNNADPNIPVVVYFTDGTWYDGHIGDDGHVELNYPETRPFAREFASIYLVRERSMIYLGRAFDTETVELKIAGDGSLQFRALVKGADGADYYPIATTGELMLINRDDVSRGDKYKQMRDLNLLGFQPGTEAYRALNWEPLGRTSNRPFTGVYDGDGKNINYLYVSKITAGAGLFGYTRSGAEPVVLKNIIVKSGSVAGTGGVVGALCGDNGGQIIACENYIDVEGTSNVGGLAGINRGEITGAFDSQGKLIPTNRGEVYSSGENAGGVAGSNSGGTITDCANEGIIGREDSGRYCGGIAGSSSGTIKNCENTGEVFGFQEVGGIAGIVSRQAGRPSGGLIENSHNKKGRVNTTYLGGGVAGENHGQITGCSNSGDVNGADNIGGVCGRNWLDDATGAKITASLNTGKVSGRSYIGGVAGANSLRMRINARPQIIACYNTGDVQGDDNVGGVSGTNQGTITASFNTGSVTGGSYVGGVAGLNTAIHWDADPAKNPSDVTQREGWYIAEITACYNTG